MGLAVAAAPASAAEPPKVEIGTITEASYTTATVKGKLSSDGSGFGATTYTFEYSTDGTNWSVGFKETVTGGVLTDKSVGGKLSVPKGGTEYFVRMTAYNGFFGSDEAFSPAVAPYPSFTTLAVDSPKVLKADNASEVSYTTAKATGEIERPANADPAFDTNCRFEYVTDAKFDATGYAEAAPPVPCGIDSLTTPNQKKQVEVPLSDLTPGTEYHLRLTASDSGPDASLEAASTFTTLAVAAPSVVSIENAGEVEYTQAQVKGVVKRPAGSDPVFDAICNFEYVTDEQFNDNPPGKEFTGATQVGCEPENPVTSPDGQAVTKPVHATLGSLAPQTTYHLRLSASNPGGSDAKQAAATFTTAGPIPAPSVIATDEATDLAIHTATATGEVKRPAGADPALDTNCHFEYISDDAFNNNPPGEEFAGAGRADCIQNPITDATVEPDGTQEVSAQLGGLKANTTFHLRLVAENVGGTDSKDATGTFTTLEAEKPTVTIDPVASGTYTTAHVSGTVGEGAGSGLLLGYYESSTDGGASWNQAELRVFSDTPNVGGVHVTEKNYTGLQPGTTYLFRISAWHDHAEGLQAPFDLGEVAFSAVESITTEPLAAPTAILNPVTGVTATTAHLSGTVDPHAPVGPLSALGKQAYATHWEFICTPECPDTLGALHGTVQGEEGAQPVSFDAKRLETNTPYQVTLVVKNGGDLEATAGPVSFETPLIPPTVKSLPGGSDGEGGYILAGVVNPNHSEITKCEFKWGPNAPAYAFSAPCSPLAPINGGKPVTVEAHLTGLNPGAVYHADLVIETVAFGADDSKDFAFTPTLAAKGPPCPNEQLRAENNSLALPECRAYEQVTYPNKQGSSAGMVDFNGGDALAYESGAENLVNSGPSATLRNSYVATRTAAGWETIPDLNGPTGSLNSAPEFAEANLPGAYLYSSDLLSSIWPLRKEGTNGQFYPYLRRPDGRFVQVGVGATDKINDSFFFAASDDLTHVVFSSAAFATTWGPGVYEFVGTGNDQPSRVDVDNPGDPASECLIRVAPDGGLTAAEAKAVSSDGRVIVFKIGGGCGGANPPANELWARVDGTTSFDVSASECDRTAVDPGGPCNAPVGIGGCSNTADHGEIGSGCRGLQFQGAAKDGSRVYFTTTQQLVDGDTDQTADLYACDIPTTPQAPVGKANPCSALHEASAGSAGNAQVQQVLSVSDDGSTAYFTAKGVLAENEDALGEEAVAGDENLYVWRTDAAHPSGQTTFVARLPVGEGHSTELTAGLSAQTTPDGRYLLLQTHGQLVPTDTDTATDIYRYDAVAEEMARVSTGVSGAGGNADFDASIAGPNGQGPIFATFTHNSHPAISDDGELIAFVTEEALSPLDGNGEPDAYLWNAGHVVGSLGQAVSAFMDGSGQDIYIETAARLTATDVDTQGDVYDVRVDGGFPQHQEGCAGETCQPGATPAPPRKAPSSEQPGSGNPSQPKPCPKGKVKKHGKCVKKGSKKHSGKKHHHNKNKRASSNQGSGK